jgi:hypothetical protein
MIIALSLRLWSTIKAAAQEGPTSPPMHLGSGHDAPKVEDALLTKPGEQF